MNDEVFSGFGKNRGRHHGCKLHHTGHTLRAIIKKEKRCADETHHLSSYRNLERTTNCYYEFL